MGTRASFWIGDPRDVENRQWLGCKAWDGYPDNKDFAPFSKCSREQFWECVKSVIDATPDKGWPYPWSDNIFLTDFTYAFFDDKVMVACYRTGFYPFDDVIKKDYEWPEKRNLPSDIPAPAAYDPTQPDSIMVMYIKKGE